MLDEEITEMLVERLANRVERGNEYILKEIADTIQKFKTLNPKSARQLAQILKYGGNYKKIAKELARYTELNLQDIYDIFEEVAKKNQQFAKQFYDYRKIQFIPYEKNKQLQRQVKALATITAKEYSNLSKTLAFATKDNNGKTIYKSIRETYIDTIDEAVLSISQGKDTFQNQMKRVINQLGQSGIRTVSYESGYSRRLDTAVRMNMQDALRDLSNTLQKQFGEEYGADGVEISVHKNPAPDHEPIQGHQFSNEEYEKMQNSLPFEDINGVKYKAIDRHIGQYNCYHYVFSIVIGVSKPSYNQKELDNIIKENKQGFEFEGRHYTNYEGTQLQRKLETEIRKQKDIHVTTKNISIEEAYKAQKKLDQTKYVYAELSKKSRLPTKIERLKVDGYKRLKGNIREYYESVLIGTEVDGIKITGISEHLLERIISRNVSIEDIKDSLDTPLKKGIIKVDKEGRKSINYTGEKATTVMNPENGVVISTWKTSSKRVERLKGEK